MEQLQQPPFMPHLVQVYQPSVTHMEMQSPQFIHISDPSLPTLQGDVTYQQIIPSDTICIPLTSEDIAQLQISMSCQSIQPLHDQLQSQVLQSMDMMQPLQDQLQPQVLQTMDMMQPLQDQLQPQVLQSMDMMQPLQDQLQSQVLQSMDMNQSLQMASHMIVPQPMIVSQPMIVPQHMIAGEPSFQYEYPEEPCIVINLETEMVASQDQVLPPVVVENNNECETDTSQIEPEPQKEKADSEIPDPTTSTCNIRKSNHQRGESKSSRRGKRCPNDKRRERTVYTKAQLRRLEAEFLRDNYVTRERRHEIAVALQLTGRQVKFWFQTRRMKKKRTKVVSKKSIECQADLN